MMPSVREPTQLWRYFALALWLPYRAFAHLGGDEASVGSDSAQMHAHMRSTPTVNYDVAELTTDSGLIIREYLTRGGKVFAVTWQGPVLPDLRTLLANYFSRYSYALDSLPQAAAQRHIHVAQSDLVVESMGHMRAFSGRAYVPSLVPPTVKVDELP